MAEDLVLEVKDIDKSFPGTKALSKVNFQLRKGEIHAVVGENGAGKSTLMNVIDGVYTPDAGEIYINGHRVHIKDPLAAQKLGIGFVHQEIALCPDVTVAENLYMASINASKALLVNYKELYAKTAQALESLHPVDPYKKVGELSISNQQVVEIAKALTLDCRILILDEPTAVLTESETEALFQIMQKLKAQGISIIYISHRMAEVFGQCDRVSVLRDGQYIGTFDVDQTNSTEVVNMMVGREIGDLYPPKADQTDQTTDVLLQVSGFKNEGRFEDISFELFKGEILGFSGLVGAGRSELAKAICGLYPKRAGEVIFKGNDLEVRNYEDAIRQGIVYLTEDRKTEGLFLEMPISNNIVAMDLKQVSSRGVVDGKLTQNLSSGLADKLNIKFHALTQLVSSLSGGNQQKVLIAKLLSVNPAIIIMDEPTRGIDVGAKSEIHRLLRELANQGIGVIMISSELPEIIGMCDRVMVMHEGRKCDIISGDQINEEHIIQLASGMNL
ncbi:MAG: sugar ABC transporter ATP-binding protein [bacterium]|nr:sugar ABC transporter ATP-binding protein [bacterium]